MKVQKKRRRNVRFRLKFFILILFFAAIGYVSWYYIVKKDVFALENIQIVGLKNYSKDYFIEKTGIQLGQNILLIREKQINKEIDSMKRIRQIDIKIKMPNTLTINVEERDPVALLQLVANFYLVDTDGIIFAKASKTEEYDLPCVYSSTQETFNLGDDLKKTNMADVFVLLQNIPDNLHKNISEVLYINGDVVLYTVDGVKIFWGDPVGDFERKIKVLAKVPLILRENTQVGYIDIRYGDNPVIKTLESGD